MVVVLRRLGDQPVALDGETDELVGLNVDYIIGTGNDPGSAAVIAEKYDFGFEFFR
jgi:hypothetical protein